jgi:hypothetical protein
MELNAHRVVERELGGAPPGESPITINFMKQYFAARTASYVPGSGKIIDMSDRFFSLAAVVDWLAPEGGPIVANAGKFDDILTQRINQYRADFETDPSTLDRRFPAVSYAPRSLQLLRIAI